MKHPEHPWPANLYFLLSCVYIYRLLCCRRRQVKGLGSTTFPTCSFSLRKRLATGCIPPCIVVLAFIAVRKSCCVMVSRTLVERCGRASPSSLGCKRKLYTQYTHCRSRGLDAPRRALTNGQPCRQGSYGVRLSLCLGTVQDYKFSPSSGCRVFTVIFLACDGGTKAYVRGIDVA